MASLPFQRIAIFSAELLFPRPMEEMKAKELTARVQTWAKVAVSKGAQAFYLRFQGDAGLFAHLLQALRDQEIGHLILPFPFAHLARLGEGIHYRSFDPVPQTHPFPDPPSPFTTTSRSCHSLQDIQEAEAAGFTFAFLSPIFPTRTHPEAEPLGLEMLKHTANQCGIPIFALGGINQEYSTACQQAGAHGIAGIRMFFS